MTSMENMKSEWLSNCINVSDLTQKLEEMKTKMSEVDGASDVENFFISLSSGSKDLDQLETNFFQQLEQEVKKANNFFTATEKHILSLPESDTEEILNSLPQLVNFGAANLRNLHDLLLYHDSFSCFPATKRFLSHRVAHLPLWHSTSLLQRWFSLGKKDAPRWILFFSFSTEISSESLLATVFPLLRGWQVVEYSVGKVWASLTLTPTVPTGMGAGDVLSALRSAVPSFPGVSLKVIPLGFPKTLPVHHYSVTAVSSESLSPLILEGLCTQWKNVNAHVKSVKSLKSFEAVEWQVDLPESAEEELKKQLTTLSIAHSVDISLQRESLERRHKRLVVFDMDSTLIRQEVIDELARHGGVYEAVAMVTEQAMRGELDFNASLNARVALLKGQNKAELFQKVLRNLQFTPGAHFLCRVLKKLGYRMAVISGGFEEMAKHVREELGLDYSFANRMEEKDGLITGTVGLPIVNAQRKADLLSVLAQREGVPLSQVIAVGDGANDLLMLGAAGLGIAFNAKPKVQAAAKHRINQPSLRNVLYLLGISEEEAEQLDQQ